MARNPWDIDLAGKKEEDAVRLLGSFFSVDGNFPLPPLPFDGLRGVCRSAYAESLLFCRLVRGEDLPVPPGWEDFSPFGPGTPPLGRLMRSPGAVARFPTCAADRPRCWNLYLFAPEGACPGGDHRRFLAENALIGSELRIFLSCGFSSPGEKLDGDSWQLAFCLAQLELQNRTSAPRLFRKLVTGAVSSGLVKPVTIGTKTDLLRREEFDGFLLPADCAPETESVNGVRLDPVKTVEQAWRIVSGTGIDRAEISLPDPVGTLDILVGQAWRPVIAVILQLAPRRVRLWCSQETRPNAESVRTALAGIPGLSSEAAVFLMDSHDLQQSYTDFYAVLERESGPGDVVCNTGGNRLMGTAALLAAQTRGLKVVYRDINARPDVLTVIEFGRENRYLSADLHINRCPVRSRIRWDTLYGRGDPGGAEHDILSTILSTSTEE